jgi:hypothetical protein
MILTPSSWTEALQELPGADYKHILNTMHADCIACLSLRVSTLGKQKHATEGHSMLCSYDQIPAAAATLRYLLHAHIAGTSHGAHLNSTQMYVTSLYVRWCDSTSQPNRRTGAVAIL